MSSSSEDITIIDAPLASSSRARLPSRLNARAGPSRHRDLAQLSSDSDDPVFVGTSSMGARLAEKFAFQESTPGPSSRSRSRSTTVEPKAKVKLPIKPRVRGTSAKKEEEGGEGEEKKRSVLNVRDVLVSQTTVQPTPPPTWLGQPKILLRLGNCPVCKRQLKKSESGPARWVSRYPLLSKDLG